MADVERNYEFWLLGLPSENIKKTHDKIKKLTRNVCVSFQFYVPQLRIGTLDLLLKASIELQKLESTTTDVISRIVMSMRDVLGLERDVMKSMLVVKGRPMPHYLHKFNWETEAYPPHLSIKSLHDLIIKEVSLLEVEIKKQLDEYTTIKQTLDVLERTQKGSLLTRNISHLVKKEDFVEGSEHLVTVVVVVAKVNYGDWLNSYELLDDEVVPRSSKLLFEEGEFGLFNVTLFKRHLKEFTHRARGQRFFVRDFVYDAKKITNEADHLSGLRKDKMQMDKPLLRLLKSSFSDIYSALIHVLGMRLFVESILRYGLPTRYLYLYVIVPKREVKKARTLLMKEYAYLEMKPSDEEKKKKEPQREDDCPFVSFNVRCDLTDF